MGHEEGVHDYTKTFHLEVDLVQGLKGAAIIEVMIEWDGEMGIHDGGDKSRMFGRGWEEVEAVTVNGKEQRW